MELETFAPRFYEKGDSRQFNRKEEMQKLKIR